MLTYSHNLLFLAPDVGHYIVIYIDQPIGTGFSFGNDTVNSTQSAAPFVWKAFQVLFESQAFNKYSAREYVFATICHPTKFCLAQGFLCRFILATESYGGHYGPAFVTFFDQQNALIQQGCLEGEIINVSALMINKLRFSFLSLGSFACTQIQPGHSGWYDPLIQYQAYVDFATNAPGYGQLQPDDVLAQLNTSYFGPGGCKEQEEACYAAGTDAHSDEICKKADDFCVRLLFSCLCWWTFKTL